MRKTYHVDNGHANTSDLNDGLRHNNCLSTIQTALLRWQPGDTVLVYDGTYREQLDINTQSGVDMVYQGNSWSECLTLRAADGNDNVIIKGSEVVTGWTQYDHPSAPPASIGQLYRKQNWHAETTFFETARRYNDDPADPVGGPEGRGYKEDFSVPKRNANTQMVFCDGERLQQIYGEVSSTLSGSWYTYGRIGSDISDMIAGSFFVDGSNLLDNSITCDLYVWLEDGSNPNTHTMEVPTRPFLLFVWDMQYTRVHGLKFHHGQTSNYNNWTSVIFRGQENMFTNCEVINCDQSCFSFYRSRTVDVIDNVFSDAGNLCCAGTSEEACRWVGNEFANGNFKNYNVGWGAGGLKIIPYNQNVIVSNNTAHSSNGSGLWFDHELESNNILDANITYQNTRAGIHYEIGQRGIITNNICYLNGLTGIDSAQNSSDCYMAHNTCYKNGIGIETHNAGRLANYNNSFLPEKNRISGIIVHPSRNTRIIGNIVMESDSPERSVRIGFDDYSGANPDIRMTKPNPTFNANADAHTIGGEFSDYNVFYRASEGSWFQWNSGMTPDTDAFDFDSWKTVSLNDLSSVVGDPLFEDPDNGDFRIKAGSPAIKLVPVEGPVAHDFYGNPRKKFGGIGTTNYRTAGAIEYGSQPPSP